MTSHIPLPRNYARNYLETEMDTFRRIAESLGLDPDEVETIAKKRFQIPNLSPPNVWRERPSPIPFIKKWIFILDPNLVVQGGAEKWEAELWLRLSTSYRGTEVNEGQLKLIMRDFLGEQWVEPNKRTFIHKPQMRLSNNKITHILFCLSGTPTEASIPVRMMKMGVIL